MEKRRQRAWPATSPSGRGEQLYCHQRTSIDINHMTEDEFQNICIVCYFLAEQGRLDEALSVLLLASESFGNDLAFNRMLIMIFYLKKDFSRCAVIFRKFPQLIKHEPVFETIERICTKSNEEKKL